MAYQAVGALWYLFSIESEVRCWRRVLNKPDSRLTCNHDNETIAHLNSVCAIIDPSDITNSSQFDFGIYYDALQSNIVQETTDFPQKFFYCLWWGLRSVRLVLNLLCFLQIF